MRSRSLISRHFLPWSNGLGMVPGGRLPRSVLHEEVEHVVELARRDARAAGLLHRARHQVLDVLQALLAQKLHVAAGDEAALALHRLDEPLGLEVGVGALVGDDA